MMFIVLESRVYVGVGSILPGPVRTDVAEVRLHGVIGVQALKVDGLWNSQLCSSFNKLPLKSGRTK